VRPASLDVGKRHLPTAAADLRSARCQVFNARARQIKIDFNEALQAFRFSLTVTERALLNGAKVNLQFFKTKGRSFPADCLRQTAF
jgi:hypothetical protein